jgi:hypothetical protein
VRDGRWTLKLAQRGYPEILEPLARTQLFALGQMHFDLASDPGERHDLSAEHPDVVARLTREIAAFEASLALARPILVDAAPQDHLGCEKMWCGVAGAFAATLAAVAVLLFATYRTLRWFLRR